MSPEWLGGFVPSLRNWKHYPLAPPPFIAVTVRELQSPQRQGGLKPTQPAFTALMLPLLLAVKFLAVGFSQGRVGLLPAGTLAVKLNSFLFALLFSTSTNLLNVVKHPTGPWLVESMGTC